MYKIILTCMDANAAIEPYEEEIKQLFKNRDEAEIYMLHTVNDEVSNLNQPDANNTPHTEVFIADLNGEHDAIVRLWDGEDYWDVTYYDIVEVEPVTKVKNIKDYQLKKCIFLTGDEFGRIVYDLLNATVEYTLEGWSVYDDEDIVDANKLYSALKEHFGLEQITSIHIDDCDYPVGVWIVYK